MNIHPVIGPIVPYEVGFGNDLSQFHNAPFNIHGLCKVTSAGKGIEFVSIISEIEGVGNCSRFIDALMNHYRVIIFWEIWATKVESALRRRGFRPVSRQQDTRIFGLGWTEDRVFAACKEFIEGSKFKRISGGNFSRIIDQLTKHRTNENKNPID